MLRTVETLILDEVHAVAGTKRGAISRSPWSGSTGSSSHRCSASASPPRSGRWRRSAASSRAAGRSSSWTRARKGARPRGGRAGGRHARAAVQHHASYPAPADGQEMDAGTELGARSIWPSIYPEILRLVEQHRSTIVFVNNRRLAERLALRLNELAERELARAHHGSLAREQRSRWRSSEEGEIPCLVATSSLELGIDMGAVDLVIQVESPKSVARGLQRIGRAGHELGAVSKGRIFPKFRADLLESAVVSRRMRDGAIEETVIPRNPLDVLAQQIVAICAEEEVAVDDLHEPRPRRVSLLRPVSRPAGERARHARRPLSLRRVRRAAAPHHMGPNGRHDPRPGRCPPAGGDERGHDPDRGLFTVQLADSGSKVGRARRGDGVRSTGRADVPAGSVELADRGDHARPRARVAGAGRTRSRAVLEGRGRGTPYELGQAIGRATRAGGAVR